MVLLHDVWRAPFSAALHQFLRLPLRTGLFANFERGRFLRQRISNARLIASPIRVVFTATDLETGTGKFFTNTRLEDLARDPRVDERFIAEEVTLVDDVIRAVVASSALPIAYEPMTLDGRLYADGALVANQPIRPALRLGADVLFLVTMEPPNTGMGEVKTFIDVGLRALDILMLQNLTTDLKILHNVNAACEHAAAERGLHPEEIEIDLGPRRYRWVKSFTVSPARPLRGTVLDFGEATAGPAILQGYADACVQIENFLVYAPQARHGRPKQILRFAKERAPEV
jgi:predicted acylesterase/phospholipase RssA